MEQDSSHDSKNSDTRIQTNDEPIAQEDLEPSQPDVEIRVHATPPIMSPKRSKNLKIDRLGQEITSNTNKIMEQIDSNRGHPILQRNHNLAASHHKHHTDFVPSKLDIDHCEDKSTSTGSIIPGAEPG
jgi:hypothetical protein